MLAATHAYRLLRVPRHVSVDMKAKILAFTLVLVIDHCEVSCFPNSRCWKIVLETFRATNMLSADHGVSHVKQGCTDYSQDGILHSVRLSLRNRSGWSKLLHLANVFIAAVTADKAARVFGSRVCKTGQFKCLPNGMKQHASR